MIAGPICFNGHWKLCVILVKESKFILFNSLSLKRSNNRCEEFKNWKSFCCKFQSAKLADIHWRFFSIDCVQQKDTFNCGTFICYYLKCVINDEFDKLKVEFDPVGFRKEIFETIKPKLMYKTI